MIRAQFLPAILMTLVLTIFTGFCFPVLIWGMSQVIFSDQANGSLVKVDGKVVGSSLLGQNFAAPKYFHPRPSAAGAGYDPLASSGTNLGPTSNKLFSGIPNDPATEADESYSGVDGLAKAYREENGLTENSLVPVDAVTRSSSGLDPHITPRNAKLQATRVARERGLKVEEVNTLIERRTETRFLGIFGEPRINVLMLNLELDTIKGK